MLELINKLIEVRDIAHQMHFSKTDSGYHHEALQEFYESILEFTDEFVEVYQGQYGLIEDFGTFNEVDFSDKEKYFTDFANFVNSKRSEINDDEAVHLQAIIDDIMITTYKLLYKLKNLK